MSQPITFISTCPTCGHQQLQDGYTHAALVRLLERGRIIEAYCLACDVLWPISPEERAAMARAIVSEQHEALFPGGDRAPERPTEGRGE
jgi:hypothetical protein